jgi:hypothetical protein
MPELPRIQPGPVGLGRQASGDDFGAGAAAAAAQRGRAGAQLGAAAAELAEADRRIAEAELGARVDRAVAESAAEYEAGIEALEEDPDLDGRAEKLARIDADIARKHGGQFEGRWREEYETRLVPVIAGAGGRVRSGVRRARKDRAAANIENTLNTEADLGARTLDPEQRAASRGRAQGALERAQAAGLIDASTAQARLERFDAEQMEALALGWIRDDPAGAKRELEKGPSGQFGLMREDARQRAIGSADGELRQRDQIAKAERAEREARAKEQRQQLEEETEKKLLAAAVDGALTVDDVKQNRGGLSASAFGQFLGMAAEARARPADPREVYRLDALRFDNPQAFLREAIDPEKVGPKKAIELKEAQSKLRNGDPAPTGTSFRERMHDRLKASKGLDDDERAQLYRISDEKFQEFARDKGSRPSAEEEQRIIDEVLLRRAARVPTGIFGLGAGDTIILPDGSPASVPGVPPEHVDGIVDSLKGLGKPINAQSILDSFRKAKAMGIVK